MGSGSFMVYMIERKLARERTFKPMIGWSFGSKREARAKIEDLRAHQWSGEFRVTAYWDKRPW